MGSIYKHFLSSRFGCHQNASKVLQGHQHIYERREELNDAW